MTDNQIPQLALTAIHKIIDEEGGFVYTDHPVDPDRGTYAGIRYITFLTYYLNNNPGKKLSPISFRNMALSNQLKPYVLDIYYNEYFQTMNLEELPDRLIMPVFSCGVNCGTRKAIKILQKSCNEMEDVKTLLKVDGINGKRTSDFVHRLCIIQTELADIEYSGDHTKRIRNNFIKNWIHYYIKVVNYDHKDAVFILGWFNRANKYWVV